MGRRAHAWSTDGSTVLLTTQYLEEADALADEITVIDHGRVIAHDTPDGLKRVVGGQRIAVQPVRPGRLDDVAAILRRGRPATRPSEIRRGRARRCRSTATGALTATVARWRRRHRRHRAVPAPAQPGRGLHDPHRQRADDDTTTTKEGGGGMTHRQPRHTQPRRLAAWRPPAVARRPRPFRLVRHALVLAKRSLIKTCRTPEALIDVTLQPVIFLVHLHLHLRWRDRAGSQQDYLQFLLPGLLGAVHRDGRRRARRQNLNADIAEGRLRPVPVAADRPVGAAGRRRLRRLRPLPDRCASSRWRFGFLMGFRVQTSLARRAGRGRALDRLRAVLLLDLGLRRHDLADPGRGAGR